MREPDRSLKRPLKILLRLEAMFTTEQFTFSQLRRMYVPLLLDQLFMFAIGVLSSAMVSSSGEAAISAVSMVGTIGFIASSLFNSISTGGAIVVAQARGSGDEERVRATIGQTILLATLVALFCAALLTVFAEPLVHTLYAQAEPLLLAYAVRYLRLISLSFVPYAAYSAVFNIFRGLGDSKSSLVLTVVINTAHLVFSFILINMMKLGVTGSGLSYLFARLIGVFIALLWMFRIQNANGMRVGYSSDCERMRCGRDSWRKFSMARTLRIRAGMASIIKIGIPLATEQILFQAGVLLTQVYISTLPTVAIAANAIANSAFGLYHAVCFTLTAMVTTVCGQCVGAKQLELAKGYMRSFIKAGRFLLLFAAMLISAVMPAVLRLYSPTAEAMPLIALALIIGVVPLPLLWCDANIPGAAMRAAGDAVYVTVTSLIAMWVARVLVGYLLTIVLGLGIAGVWLGLVLQWAIQAALLSPRIKSGRWLVRVS